jgi:hypothetical protein
MCITDGDLQIPPTYHPPGHRSRVSGHPDKATHPRLPQSDQLPIRFPEWAFQVDELDVVQLQDIDVVGAQPAKALLEAPPNSVRREVELIRSVLAGLSADDDLLTPPAQHLAESPLSQPLAVGGAAIEEIDTGIHRSIHRLQRSIIVVVPNMSPNGADP